MITLLRGATILVAAASVAGCASVDYARKPTPSVAPPPAERIAAIEQTRSKEIEYFESLAASVKAETRDGTWAARQESALRDSYAAYEGAPSGALKNVECRSSKCDLQLQLDPKHSARTAVDQRIAIDQWIAWSQPCGYAATFGSDPNSGTLRIFLDCER